MSSHQSFMSDQKEKVWKKKKHGHKKFELWYKSKRKDSFYFREWSVWSRYDTEEKLLQALKSKETDPNFEFSCKAPSTNE